MNTVSALNSIIPENQTYIIGREGHIYLGDISVSRQHAEVTFREGKIRLRDLNSTNGIFLVKNKVVVRVEEEYVNLTQPILIGGHRCTVEELLEGVEQTQISASV